MSFALSQGISTPNVFMMRGIIISCNRKGLGNTKETAAIQRHHCPH
jgi:hypothetical protein